MPILAVFSVIYMLGAYSAWAQAPERYQKAAQAALQAQISREGKDCLDARTTADENNCLANAATMTQHDFDAFYGNLLSLLGSESANQQKLDEAQVQWVRYRDKTCEAIGYLYSGGSIQSSAITRCRIELIRSRMHDLDSVYHTILHN